MQVSVKRDHNFAAHAFERGHDRHVLAVVGIEIDDAGDIGPHGLLGPEQVDGTVRAAVVGKHDLVAASQCIEYRIQAREKRREIQRLVVDRNYNGKLGHGTHGFILCDAPGEWQ